MKYLKILIITFSLLYFMHISLSFTITKKDLKYDIDLEKNICYVKEIVNYRLEKSDFNTKNEIKLNKVFPQIDSKFTNEKNGKKTPKNNLKFRNLNMDFEYLNMNNIILNKFGKDLTGNLKGFNMNKYDKYNKYFDGDYKVRNKTSFNNGTEELYVYDIIFNKNKSLNGNNDTTNVNNSKNFIGENVKISFDYEIHNYFTVLNNSISIYESDEEYKNNENNNINPNTNIIENANNNNKKNSIKIKQNNNTKNNKKINKPKEQINQIDNANNNKPLFKPEIIKNQEQKPYYEIYELQSYIYLIPEIYEIIPDDDDNDNEIDIYLRNYRKDLTHSNIKFPEISDFDIYKATSKTQNKNSNLKEINKRKSNDNDILKPYKIKIKQNKISKRFTNDNNKDNIQIKKLQFNLKNILSSGIKGN